MLVLRTELSFSSIGIDISSSSRPLSGVQGWICFRRGKVVGITIEKERQYFWATQKGTAHTHTRTHARTHAHTHTHEPNKLTINDIEKINLRLIIHSLYKNPVNFN